MKPSLGEKLLTEIRLETPGYVTLVGEDGAVVSMPMSVVCESSDGMSPTVWSNRTPRFNVSGR